MKEIKPAVVNWDDFDLRMSCIRSNRKDYPRQEVLTFGLPATILAGTGIA